MSRLEDVRAALLPLKKRGLVHSVWPGGRRLTSLTGSVLQVEPIAVDLTIDRETAPESHREKIEGMIKQAGITGIALILRRRPPA